MNNFRLITRSPKKGIEFLIFVGNSAEEIASSEEAADGVRWIHRGKRVSWDLIIQEWYGSLESGRWIDHGTYVPYWRAVA